MALFWPTVTFATLIVFMGAYLFVDGVFSVVGALGARKYNENWWVFLLSGICGIALGILTFTIPWRWVPRSFTSWLSGPFL
ncbi:DUF308 domain-containing protein [Chitinophaga sedimenti]|uniref:DUF308 domain-containing protein n=1 Tax=Chitinophaga sedimenti TaxID=2033606 RepID=UPI0035564176